MIYVTSDLHGYPLKDFKALLAKADFGEDDFLYVLGDVIDRNGDGGIEMLLWMMEQPNIELLRGNHEQMLLSCGFMFKEVTDESIGELNGDQMSCLMNWMFNGAEPTIASLRALNARNPQTVRDLLDYLSETPLYDVVSTDAGDFVLVHAGLGNFYHGKKLRQYKMDELLWHRPAIGEQYFDNVTTILGHTPVMYYGCPAGRAMHSDTWIDIDVGAASGNAPMLLRLDDMKEFYMDE